MNIDELHYIIIAIVILFKHIGLTIYTQSDITYIMVKEKGWNEIKKPQVFIKDEILYVIYKNREVLYRMDKKMSKTFKQIKENDNLDNYTKEDSIELCKNGGMRELHYTSQEEKDAAWKNILKKEV